MTTQSLSALSFLTQDIRTFDYKRGKVTLQLEIDIDAFTSSYFRAVRTRMRDRFQRLAEQDREARARIINLVLERERKLLTEKQAAKETEITDPAQLTAEVIERRLNMPEIVDPDEATAWMENEAKTLDTKKEILIELLRGDLDDKQDGTGSGVLVGWTIPDVDIACTRDSLNALSNRALEELWDFCSEQAHTVKKTTAETDKVISEITGAGLRASPSNGLPT